MEFSPLNKPKQFCARKTVHRVRISMPSQCKPFEFTLNAVNEQIMSLSSQGNNPVKDDYPETEISVSFVLNCRILTFHFSKTSTELDTLIKPKQSLILLGFRRSSIHAIVLILYVRRIHSQITRTYSRLVEIHAQGTLSLSYRFLRQLIEVILN